MTKAPSWRKIEAALIEACRTYRIDCDRNPDTGDAYADTTEWPELNLTDLAKELEQRL